MQSSRFYVNDISRLLQAKKLEDGFKGQATSFMQGTEAPAGCSNESLDGNFLSLSRQRSELFHASQSPLPVHLSCSPSTSTSTSTSTSRVTEDNTTHFSLWFLVLSFSHLRLSVCVYIRVCCKSIKSSLNFFFLSQFSSTGLLLSPGMSRQRLCCLLFSPSLINISRLSSFTLVYLLSYFPRNGRPERHRLASAAAHLWPCGLRKRLWRSHASATTRCQHQHGWLQRRLACQRRRESRRSRTCKKDLSHDSLQSDETDADLGQKNKRALYVGGLDPRVTEDVLKQIFETTG